MPELNNKLTIIFNDFINSINNSFSNTQLELLKKAFIFCNQLSINKVRASGEEYTLHPLRVAQIVSNEISLGINSIIAAILHDVLKDN